MNNISLYFNTIKYFRWKQLRHQVGYRIISPWRYCPGSREKSDLKSECGNLEFDDWIHKTESLKGDNCNFLNLSKSFKIPKIEWNYIGFGKLWNYNLNYMDFLLQLGMGRDLGIKLIHEFIQNITNKSTGLDPYPISLRGINWIKFFSIHKIQDREADISLFMQYTILCKNPEYHLMGNHLLENGFSLLFGACYFNDQALYKKAKRIIETELEEQILNDGGHFELSPMYHQIILDRLLDSVNLLKNNKLFESQVGLLELMQRKALMMVQWLNSITFSDGQIPLLNDSAKGIAPSTNELNNYAVRLGVTEDFLFYKTQLDHKLKDSCYRRFSGENYECILDVGQVGPDYQPGHAHADTFSFTLNWDNKPIIIDPGVSTYQKNEIRHAERSTKSHNTVTITGKNSSDVWGGFRVGKRARVNLVKDGTNEIIATHNGYQRSLGILHQRTFSFSATSIVISDQLIGKKSNWGEGHLHFPPDLLIRLLDGRIILGEAVCIYLDNNHEVMLSNYQCPIGFNQYRQSMKCTIRFKESMQMSMQPYINQLNC